MIRILLFYMGKDGLSTIEEINGWIALGPKRYEDVLSSEEIQEELRSRGILKPAIDQGETLAERKKIWMRLVQLVCAAHRNSVSQSENGPFVELNLIIIQGPPGVGKTMFMNRLYSDPVIQSRFDEVFQASYDLNMSPQTFLDFCLQKLLPGEDWHPGQPTILKTDLRKALSGKRIMFLVDTLSSANEIDVLKPLSEMGCLLVVATRSLEVARQVDYSNVIELKSYSKSDVLEYYSKNYALRPSQVTQEKLLQLAEMVCFNPLGLNIALRRVAEEGWETVMKKVCLAPAIWKEGVFKDLHKPLWLAYSSLSAEDQDKFRKLGILPTLAGYDEERLSLFWGISRTKANEILVRLEKEAGLARRCPQRNGCWHFHPQVMAYARYLLNESPVRTRILSGFYPIRLAFHEKRPVQFHHLYKKGVKPEVVKTYWAMIRQEWKRRRLPIILSELRRTVDLAYSPDWSIFKQLTPNCTLEDYTWGYRNYLEGKSRHPDFLHLSLPDWRSRGATNLFYLSRRIESDDDFVARSQLDSARQHDHMGFSSRASRLAAAI